MYAKTILVVLTSVFLVVMTGSCEEQTSNFEEQKIVSLKNHPTTDACDGWRLGAQAYTFNRFTFYEAIDKTASLGLEWIEAYPGQRLSREKPNLRFDHNSPPEIRDQVKAKLADAGLRIINYGVVGMGRDEAKCRKVFDFAKDMGIETIVSEPPEDAFDMIDKLCQEYKINVAIHNHPKPSHYWNPDTVLNVCKGRSKRIGACADTGHWMRSGLNPLEMLRKLEGRIICLHFKDLVPEKDGDGYHDVVWGTGRCDAEAMLKELHRQNFKGVFSIEYEYNWENSLPEVRGCVEYFNEVSGGLNPSGWRNLLAKNLSNCYNSDSWTLADGELARKGGGDLWTKQKYGDFVLDLEFKLNKGGNSGVFIRTGDIENWLHTGIEVQVYDSTDGTARGSCGAIYDCLAPGKDVMKGPGLWNHLTITAEANKIYVVMNGEEIIDMDLDLWTEPHKNPDGTPNKFNTAYRDMPRIGYIGFQDHGDPVWYRNIKIKPL
jgi:sugar phosphate isomerase/epimerase